MKRLLLLLLLLPVLVFGQAQKPNTSFITRDTLSITRQLENHWRYRTADSPQMALPAYNDSAWAFTYPEQFITDDTSQVIPRFKSVMWLRLHFITDTSLTNVPIAITMTHLGASEVYLDGRKIATAGIIKGRDSSLYIDPQWLPYIVSLATPGEHVLAVRYANFNAYRNYNIFSKSMAGFRVKMGLAEQVVGSERAQTVTLVFVLVFFFGLFTALSLLHMLMFLYYKKERSNLYFSIFSISVAFIFFLLFQLRFAGSASTQLRNSLISLAVAMLACFSFSGFSNELFSKKNKLRFRIITGLCLLFLITWFFDTIIGIYCYFILIGVVTLEAVMLTVRAIYRKVPGARIIGVGILFFALFFLAIAFIALVFKNIDINDSSLSGILLELFGAMAILSVPISMSVYLAWRFSNLNKDLNNQLVQIKDLSAKTLAQEIAQKEMLERQNQELEQKVHERTFEVQHQKELVEIKNRAITDNLEYAQRIQSAMLPDINMIHKTFGQSFILYLPKDIVSGDFYSFNHRDNKILLAAADCTGHGVSGAFMSMIGSSLLNQIIIEKGIEQPAEILNSLNTAVIETLKQSQNESTDGMDIAICSFNMAENELQYAGANRPIYLVRNNHLEILKPDKLPIGGLQVASNRVFTNHKLKLEKNDAIYLFTDGYTDQFGGEKHKKLMASRFRTMLLSIQHLSMQDQLTHLHHYFQNWKGDNEQVDDVLVMGVRV